MKQLRTILVPTDFSEAAKGSYLFARQLAQQVNATLKVVHCYTGVYDPNQVFIMDNPQEYQQVLQQRLKHFVNPSPESLPEDWKDVPLEAEPVLGFAVEGIVDLSASPEVSMIVMGTTGEHDALERLFGSVSSSVSQQAHCPVLLVPKGVSFKNFHNILYASDFLSTDDHSLHQMLDFAEQFKATLHFVHINKQKVADFEITEQLLSKLAKHAPSSRYRIVSVSDSSTIEGLNRYAQENHIDLGVLVTKHRPFWENLLHRSTTKRMALTTQLPLMVLHLGE